MNECNFICNIVQQNEKSGQISQVSHEGESQQPHLIILRSEELAQDLSKLDLEEEQTKIIKKTNMHQSNRKTSNSALRTSASSNTPKLLLKKDSEQPSPVNA
jgi:hypothetical protein